MSKSKAGPWVLGAAFLALVVLALAWFFAIAPQVDAAATARTDIEAAQGQNVIQAKRLVTLEEQSADLEVYKAELSGLQLQIPVEDGLPALLRELDAAAQAAGVTIISVSPGTPVGFVGAIGAVPEEPAAEEPAAEGEAAEGEAAEEPGAEGADAAVPGTEEPAPVGVVGFVAVPLQLTVLGTPDAGIRFITALQGGMTRLFLVTTFEATGQDEVEASGGRPATAYGDMELVINGYVYVLQEGAATEPTDPAAGENVDT